MNTVDLSEIKRLRQLVETLLATASSLELIAVCKRLDLYLEAFDGDE